MTSLQVAVTLLGIAAIVWVNWYFFLAGARPVAASAGGSGPQSVRIVVDGGYSPSVVTVARNWGIIPSTDSRISSLTAWPVADR